MENKYKNSAKKKTPFGDKNNKQTRSRVLSLAQLLSRVRKQRGFSGLVQTNSNVQSNNNPNQTSQSRYLQSGTTSKTSFGNSNNETKGKGRFYGDQNTQRDKMFLSNSSGGMNKNQKEEQKRQRPIKPIIPPKSLVIILREKPDKILYNRRIIDYKHCGLLQRYIGLGGKILPRRQTRLTAKQQRYIAKTIKSARIMGLLPFVSKEKGFFR
jgi:small subunit ribosomal protein S18